jgi:hypothetical protein
MGGGLGHTSNLSWQEATLLAHTAYSSTFTYYYSVLLDYFRTILCS